MNTPNAAARAAKGARLMTRATTAQSTGVQQAKSTVISVEIFANCQELTNSAIFDEYP
jgi:hypothetical protein